MGRRNLFLTTWQNPVESEFINSLTDNLSAEVMVVCDREMVRGCQEEEPGLL